MNPSRIMLAGLLFLVPPEAGRAQAEPRTPSADSAGLGLLVVAHGAGEEWNARVRTTVAEVRWRGPIALAFLMGPEADGAGWTQAVARLVAQGATAIRVVPLMVSSHGAHYDQVRHYAGELAELPPALVEHSHVLGDPPPVPMSVSPALDGAPELVEILLERWRGLPSADRLRPLLLLAHGPTAEADARRWQEHLEPALAALRAAGSPRAEAALVRDDAPAEIRARAIAAARTLLLNLAAADSAVVLPLLVSTSELSRSRIPRDLEGLPVRYHSVTLAPHPGLARWIERMARRSATPGTP